MKLPRTNDRIMPRAGWGALVGALLLPSPAWAQFEEEVDPLAAPEPSTEEEPLPEEPSSESDENSASAEAGASGSFSLGGSSDGNAEAGMEADGPRVEEPLEADEKALSETAPRHEAVYRTHGLWQGLRHDDNRFGIDGGMQLDVGYADYRQSIETEGPEVLHDFRGQFWVAPVMEHRFMKNKDGFVRVAAELVAWLREDVNQYQVNVFDVYAQAGIQDVVDLQVGRVTTWRLVDPGNGYDIFTLEDTGAIKTGDSAAGEYFPFRYEVDYIWLRDTPGRAALHIYPLKKFVPKEWNNLGIELTGQYGTKGRNNLDGARAAVIYDQKWIRLAGAAEYETQKGTKEQVNATDLSLCEQCTWQYRRGMGGSVTLRPPYVAGALNYADGRNVNKGANGDAGTEGEGEITTQGGYIELHTGHLIDSTKSGPRPSWSADQRSENIRKLTIGYGQRRTETLLGNGDFDRHDSRAVYIKYNFGFNESSIKFVGTYAEGISLDNTRAITETPLYIRRDGDMLAGRVRFSYYW